MATTRGAMAATKTAMAIAEKVIMGEMKFVTNGMVVTSIMMNTVETMGPVGMDTIQAIIIVPNTYM